MPNKLITTEPLFFVVIVICNTAREFKIGAIFSKDSDAEQYRSEVEKSSPQGFAVIDRMTMEEIKTDLVKDRLMSLAAVIEKQLPSPTGQLQKKELNTSSIM